MTVQLALSRRTTLLLLSAATLASCGPPAPKEPVSRVTAGQLQQSDLEPRIRAFYQARQWRPAWGRAAARQLEAAVADLDRHAIDGRRFTEMLRVKDEAGREVALTRTALGLGDALAHGLIDPAMVFEIFALERNTVQVDASLSQALDHGGLAGWLAVLPPRDAEYEALARAYRDDLKASRSPQPPAVATGKPIKPGGRDGRVPQIVQALTASGFLTTAPADADPSRYGSRVVEAIKAFQNQQGINDDGVIGDDTLAVLNAGPTDRARQIALNLEARRWLKRERPATRIDVNTAAAILYYWKDGRMVDARRVVAGKPDAATPLLSGGFRQLVVNPPWNVPQGIAEKEILPKGAGYLRANDMVVEDGRVVQKPGPKASLGRVKFDMQDKYAIYLHDTPSKAAFQANERHGSHGCVRVDDALGFARKLADERGAAADFDRKLAAADTATVDLKAEVPVRLAYHTAFMDPASGRIAFRPDIYGWDEKLAAALGMPAPMKRATAQAAADMGP